MLNIQLVPNNILMHTNILKLLIIETVGGVRAGACCQVGHLSGYYQNDGGNGCFAATSELYGVI